MPNQNKYGCCHMHGVRLGQGHVGIDAGDQILWSSNTVLHEIKIGREITKFNFCPLCGAEIDWDKIEEEADE